MTRARKKGRVGAQNSWPIDMLVPGDVLVVDFFGKIKDGTVCRDDLATAIYTMSHNGLVVDGAVRDETGISEITACTFVRDVDPSGLARDHAHGSRRAHSHRSCDGDARGRGGE